MKDNSLKKNLSSLGTKALETGIKAQFSSEENRANNFSFELDQIVYDFSKTHINHEIIDGYVELAKSLNFEQKRQDFFSGKEINNTEQRAVLHPLLRSAENYPSKLIHQDLISEAIKAQQSFFGNCIMCSEHLSDKNNKVKDIIHIGIGGSSLGTQLVFEALSGQSEEIDLHFLANVEGHQLQQVLQKCRPETTLIVAVSKSFKTRETLTNVAAIKGWFEDNKQLKRFSESLYAVTAKKKNAIKHGIPKEQIIKFPKWVGGRFSVWSSVSFSAAVILGVEKFKSFLLGASLMDEHFYNQPLEKNICFLAAAMDHFYVNYCGSQSRAVFAYDYRLRSLVDYLQQLETESNGKERCSSGELLTDKTSPVVWGGVGTEAQHSVFQLLHQGTLLIPSEFLLIAKSDHKYIKHHMTMLANGLAQPAALLEGKTEQKLRDEYGDKDIQEATFKSKIFSGDRPSTTILIDELSPKTLGSLLAFYEHRTFSYGALCDINSFDQMGVELGKQLAKQLMPRLNGKDQTEKNAMDSSTERLLKRLIDLQ